MHSKYKVDRGLDILSGYVEGEPPSHSHILDDDPRFMGLSQSEALERLDEERQGCPLCASSHPWKPFNTLLRRHSDTQIGEGQLSFPGPDFRDGLDRKECLCRADGGLFLLCLTGRDLLAHPEIMKEKTVSLEPIRGRPGEFRVRMPVGLADALGLTEQFVN